MTSPSIRNLDINIFADLFDVVPNLFPQLGYLAVSSMDKSFSDTIDPVYQSGVFLGENLCP
jgi:hypothetical protein